MLIRQLYTGEKVPLIWLFQKKIQTWGLRTCNFKGYSRKSMFQGSIKKEVEFPGLFKENSRGVSIGLGFWPWNLQVVSQNSVWSFSGIAQLNLRNKHTKKHELRKWYIYLLLYIDNDLVLIIVTSCIFTYIYLF